ALGRIPVAEPLMASHTARPWAFVLHTALGGIVLFVGPLQFVGAIRRRAVFLHRLLGYLYIVGVLVSGACGLLMGFFAAGGSAAAASGARPACAARAVTCRCVRGAALGPPRPGQVAPHRRWMIRSYALTWGAVTLRWELPMLMSLTGDLSHSYPVVAWLAWVP